MLSPLQPGTPNPGSSPPINLNHYATKKSVAESMLDVALFMSNAMRLKAVLEQGPSSPYYTTLVTLLSISLLLQVAIGILLVVIGEPGRTAKPPRAAPHMRTRAAPPCAGRCPPSAPAEAHGVTTSALPHLLGFHTVAPSTVP